MKLRVERPKLVASFVLLLQLQERQTLIVRTLRL
jgi:hypothetical protein